MPNSIAQNIKTDLELSDYFSPEIGCAYREGVEFTSVLPSHALVRFRDTLEFLCLRLSANHGQKPTKQSLYHSIECLLDGGIITFAVRNQLHTIRKLCNPGAHRVSVRKSEGKSEASPLEREYLHSNAQSARSELVSVFQRMHMHESGSAEQIEVTKSVIATQEWKDLVFTAASTANPDAKYKAGLWCEAEAEKILCSITALVVSNEVDIQIKFFMRLAATFHQASYCTKANVDAKFRYASLVEQGYLDGDKREKAIEMIRAAADAGHGEACDHYASLLYEGQHEYQLAEQYWLKALHRGVARAHFCLGMLYKSGVLGEPDPSKFIASFEKGVEEDDPDSLNALGRCYFEGDGVEKDRTKARELLLKAANFGHGGARTYLILQVNGGAERVAYEFQRLGELLSASLAPVKQSGKGKVRVNDKCSCGSGKKYKKCCGAP